MKHFDYATLDEIRRAAKEAGARHVRFVDSPAEIRAALAQPVLVGGRARETRSPSTPWKVATAMRDGRPGELTWRRYERFARGGAKLHLVRGHRRPPRGPRQPAPALDPSGQRGGTSRACSTTRAKRTARRGAPTTTC